MRRTALRMSKSWARSAAAAAHPGPEGRVAERSGQPGGQGGRVARGDEEALDAVGDHLGGAADPGHRRAAGGHGLDQGDRQALVGGGEGEGVEGGHQPGGVGPEAGEHDRESGQARRPAGGSRPPAALPDEHEADRRDGLADHEAARSRVAWSLAALKLATLPTTGASSGMPSSPRTPSCPGAGKRGRGRGRGGGSRPAAWAAGPAAPGSGSSRPPSRRRLTWSLRGRWPGWPPGGRGGSGPRGCARCRRPGATPGHHPDAGRGHRRVGVDQADALAPDQGPQPAGPAGLPAPSGSAPRTWPGELGDQAVLPGQQVGELVAVALRVQVGDAAQRGCSAPPRPRPLMTIRTPGTRPRPPRRPSGRRRRCRRSHPGSGPGRRRPGRPQRPSSSSRATLPPPQAVAVAEAGRAGR